MAPLAAILVCASWLFMSFFILTISADDKGNVSDSHLCARFATVSCFTKVS